MGSIFVDNEEANASIAKTDDKAKNVGATLAGGVKTAAKWGSAIVGGATAAVTAVTGLAKSTAEQADVVDKAAQRMGIDAEEYQKLSYAADMSGVDMGTLETAAKTLAQSMPDAEITDVIKELAAMTDETERSAKAAELLGSKAAYALAPMLNAGADGITNMMDEAEALGAVMSNDTVKAGADLNDSIDAIKAGFKGMVATLGAAVMPIVQKFADVIKDNLPTIQALIERLAPVITSLLENLLPPLLELAESIFPILFDLIEQILPPVIEITQAILPVIVQLIQMLLPPIVEIVSMVLPLLVSLLQPLITLLQPILELLAPILQLVTELLAPVIDLINILLPPLIELLTKIMGAVLPVLSTAIKGVANVVTTVFNVAISAIKPVIEGVAAAFGGAWDFIKGIWGGVTAFFKGVWDGIKAVFANVGQFFSDVFGKLGDIIKAPINFVIDGLNFLIDGLNKISFDIPDWIPAIGGKKFGFDISHIQKLEKGGDVTGDLFIANEKEPELIASNHDSTVVVNNKQIIAAVVNGVAAAVRQTMAGVVEAINGQAAAAGDIIIPIYLDGGLYDEVIVAAKERINFRSGGRADV